VVNNHLSAYKTDLAWSDLTINHLNQLKAYFQEELELSDNSIHAYLGLIRGMCDYAERNHIVVPPDRRWVEAKQAEVIRPVLEEEEIIIARDKVLEDDYIGYPGKQDVRELIRWYFIMACRTGLRRVDLWQLMTPRIVTIENTACLQVLQQKTGKFVPIPLDDDTLHYLKNPPIRKKEVPIVMAYNSNLKLIGQQSGLSRPVTVGSYYQGEMMADTIPLYEAMHSHIARRTFASQMTAAGMPTRVLQEIMGHNSIGSTERYATVSSATVVQQVIEARLRLTGKA
jgi:integrase